jgi:hypothetical protein
VRVVRLICAFIIVAQLGCAARRGADVPPSERCSGQVRVDVVEGTSTTTVSASITNDSRDPHANATQLDILFDSGPYPVEVLSPPEWTAWVRVCDDGRHLCAVEWRACPGVEPGKTLAGFRITFDGATSPLRKGWTLQVGECRTGELSGLGVGGTSRRTSGCS